MLRAIAVDLETPQTPHQQVEKSKGRDDAPVHASSAANDHGSDRASLGYTPLQMVAEFRALRASVLRLWSKERDAWNLESLNEVTRFNESIDQILAESVAKYSQDVDHAKDLFLGVLGHDLRNPLGAIMMSATGMIRRESADWPHLKTVSRILRSGTRMNSMIGDLLDFTRTRLGSGIPIAYRDLDLSILCQETAEEIAAFHPHVVVDFQTDGPLPGQWDGGRITQMLSNLVANAVQHGLADAPVKVMLRGTPDRAVLSVENQGEAIPRADLKDIFSPFVQLDPEKAKSREKGNLGLGLYIAQAIVAAHHGAIDVESTPAKTTFRVQLPRVPPPPPPTRDDA
jgi:signal transduction histidine kinase